MDYKMSYEYSSVLCANCCSLTLQSWLVLVGGYVRECVRAPARVRARVCVSRRWGTPEALSSFLQFRLHCLILDSARLIINNCFSNSYTFRIQIELCFS